MKSAAVLTTKILKKKKKTERRRTIMNSIYIDFIFVNEEEEKNTLIDLISYEQKKVC